MKAIVYQEILYFIENKFDQRFNELNNNFNEKIALLLKALVNMLMNRGLIKEAYFEKVKSIFDKINRGEKITEEDKRILRESRKQTTTRIQGENKTHNK